jgi:hypothetical protein
LLVLDRTALRHADTPGIEVGTVSDWLLTPATT